MIAFLIFCILFSIACFLASRTKSWKAMNHADKVYWEHIDDFYKSRRGIKDNGMITPGAFEAFDKASIKADLAYKKIIEDNEEKAKALNISLRKSIIAARLGIDDPTIPSIRDIYGK